MVLADESQEVRFQCRTRLCGWCSFPAVKNTTPTEEFQCRTRLCGWCSTEEQEEINRLVESFNAARGFVGGAAQLNELCPVECRPFQCRTRLCGWCSRDDLIVPAQAVRVSMPHAALWVVQHFGFNDCDPTRGFQCRTRLCGWCSFVARSPCPPREKKPFWKVSGNLRVLTENM